MCGYSLPSHLPKFLVPKHCYCYVYYYVWIKYKLPHCTVSQRFDWKCPLEELRKTLFTVLGRQGESLWAPAVWDKLLFPSQQTYRSPQPWPLAVTWQKFDPEAAFLSSSFLFFKFYYNMQIIHSLYVFSFAQNTIETTATKYICNVPSQQLQQTREAKFKFKRNSYISEAVIPQCM